MKLNKIYCLDVLEFLKRLLKIFGKRIAQIIIIDFPYNINKESWDNIDDETKWYGKCITLSLKLLKRNGSLYIFHNQFRSIRDLDFWIEKNTNLKFNNLLIWNKFFEGCALEEFLTTHLQIKSLNKYQEMKEFLLFYTLDNSYRLLKKRKKLNISQKTIANEIKSKNGNLTGWYSNIEKGKNYPTKETIIPITKYLGFEYDDIVPYFNNSFHNSRFPSYSVWDYKIVRKVDHPTPKPINLIKNILYHSSQEDDLIINLFSGSGNVEIACIEAKRKVIGCDNNPEYVNSANGKLNMLKIIYNEV